MSGRSRLPPFGAVRGGVMRVTRTIHRGRGRGGGHASTLDDLMHDSSITPSPPDPETDEGSDLGEADAVKPPTDKADTNMAPLQPHEVGMTVGLKQLYSGKEDRRGRFQWQTEIPKDVGKPAEDAESEKWAIIVRHIRVYHDPKKVLSIHSIVIQSPLIKELLQDILNDYPGVTVLLKRLEFSGRFEALIHRWPALRKAIADLEKRRDEGDADEKINDRIAHAKLLDDLLVEEFSEIEEAMEDMKNNGVITFEHLWTVFQPNSLIYARRDNQDRALLLQSGKYGYDSSNNPKFYLTCAFVDFDGQKFGTQKMTISISEFKGTKPFKSLQAFPFELHDKAPEMRATLIERGRKVEALAGTNYKGYSGIGWRPNCNGGIEKFTVKGRIVIDPLGFNRFQPDFPVYVTPFAPSSATNSNNSILMTGRGPPPPMDIDPWGSCMNIVVDVDDDGMPADGIFDDGEEKRRLLELTDEQRLICTAFVRGYSLKTKIWLYFFVNGVSDINFNERAFSALNLPNNQKDLILGFTSTKQLYGSQFDDVIEGKGKGIIILLSGPPGVGKTLTAESVAEQMKVPLYIMAAGDLGLDPRSVEMKLQDVMSMCSRWGAILLLDEADVFLEQRDLHQLERNKLVSIFLRVLEYYEGIMFLTTNRVQIFDPAFQSRIHISLEYTELDKKSRKGIWETFLTQHNVAQAASREKVLAAPPTPDASAVNGSTKRAADDSAMETEGGDSCANDKKSEDLGLIITQPHQLSISDINKLADLKLNGRQIKNFLKTAQLLAIYKKEPLSYRHVDTVISETQHLHKASEATEQARAGIFN